MPTEKTSNLPGPTKLSVCSGAQYMGSFVASIRPILRGSLQSQQLPKSMILIWCFGSLGVTTVLLGLMSLCIMPFSCMRIKPCSISAMTFKVRSLREEQTKTLT